MWKVTLTAEAQRQFARLPKSIQRDCASELLDLRETGTTWGSEQLRKHERYERSKFGSGRYRIIYRVNKSRRTILIARIAKRDSKTYKGFNPA
jgi:mRNA-degrading endonuclease RelE of RelBE toxin-antitoxin system